jgi:putative PIN family toxin of toxin-antitoxin system
VDIIIDTNVLYTALRSRRGASAKLLSLVGTGLFEVHLSVSLVLEYEDVLLRKSRSLPVTKDVIADVIDSLCALGKHHDIYFLWRPYLPDAGDEMVLEVAVASGSEYIVTYNERDFRGADRFGIKVVTPKEFLEEIGAIK